MNSFGWSTNEENAVLGWGGVYLWMVICSIGWSLTVVAIFPCDGGEATEDVFIYGSGNKSRRFWT